MNDLSVMTVANGELPSHFEHALRRILENIIDPNTAPTAARSLTLKVTFTPGADREQLVTSLQSSISLAPAVAAQSISWVGRRKDGRLVAVAADPHQRSMFGEDDDKTVTPLRKGTEQ